jgi:hypothetical protein
MAEIEINGDIDEVIRRYGNAMKFPVRYIGRVIDAYNEEPNPTQWGLLNAFTRVGTHTMHGDAQRNTLSTAGTWVTEFDTVTCKLPRPVAVYLGAELIVA